MDSGKPFTPEPTCRFAAFLSNSKRHYLRIPGMADETPLSLTRNKRGNLCTRSNGLRDAKRLWPVKAPRTLELRPSQDIRAPTFPCSICTTDRCVHHTLPFHVLKMVVAWSRCQVSRDCGQVSPVSSERWTLPSARMRANYPRTGAPRTVPPCFVPPSIYSGTRRRR